MLGIADHLHECRDGREASKRTFLVNTPRPTVLQGTFIDIAAWFWMLRGFVLFALGTRLRIGKAARQ